MRFCWKYQERKERRKEKKENLFTHARYNKEVKQTIG